MFRARQRGMSLWPFVVTLILLIVAVILWYDASKDTDTLRDERDKAVVRANELQTKMTAFQEEMLEVAGAMGFTGTSKAIGGEGYPSKDAVEKGVADALAKWREKLVLEFDTTKYTPTGAGGEIEALSGPKVRVHYIPQTASAPNLQALLPLVEQAVGRMQVDIKRAFETAAAEVTAKGTLTTEHQTALKAKDARITDLEGQLAALRAQLEEVRRDLSDQLASMTAQKDQAQSERDQLRAELEKQIQALTNQLAQATGTITTLTTREGPFLSEGPDGEVLASGGGLVVVNRGKKDFLMPGTVFSVLGRAKGGALYGKGTLKVTSVDDESARCAILEERTASDPIGRGDLIQSGTYSPTRQYHFAFVGEFRKMGRSEAEARLRALGALVDEKVTPETHYLVVGVPGAGETIEDTPAYKAAKEYGIKLITEEQLASFTRY